MNDNKRSRNKQLGLDTGSRKGFSPSNQEVTLTPGRDRARSSFTRHRLRHPFKRMRKRGTTKKTRAYKTSPYFASNLAPKKIHVTCYSVSDPGRHTCSEPVDQPKTRILNDQTLKREKPMLQRDRRRQAGTEGKNSPINLQ